MAEGDGQGLIHGHLVEATLFHDLPGGVFQYRVDVRTEFCRIDGCFLPLLGTHAVLQEIGHPALGLPVDLGGRKIQRLAVKSVNLLFFHLSDGKIRLGSNILIFLFQSQRGRLIRTSQLGKVRAGLRLRTKRSAQRRRSFPFAAGNTGQTLI